MPAMGSSRSCKLVLACLMQPGPEWNQARRRPGCLGLGGSFGRGAGGMVTAAGIMRAEAVAACGLAGIDEVCAIAAPAALSTINMGSTGLSRVITSSTTL